MARNYYLFSAGRLRRKENTLLFKNKKDRKVIPVEDMESIYVFGELDFNTKLVNFISRSGIMMHFFNYYGFYTGSFFPRKKDIAGYLTIKQAAHYLDAAMRLEIAREMSRGAAHNILKNVQYYKNRERNLAEAEARIQEYKAQIDKADSINAVLGLEGNIRKTYYHCFDEIIQGTEKMGKRTKNPPDNIINCLISFGNSLLYTLSLAEIYKTQLDPSISFYHSAGEKRFSLSLDIADIFKPVITDKLIFSVLNKGMLQPEHFEKRLNYCYLKETGRKIFLKEFDDKIKTTIKHQKLKRDVSHRRLLRLECYKLIKHLTGDEPYSSFKAWW